MGISKAAQENDFSGRNFDVVLNDILVIENLSNDNYLKPIHAYSTKTTVTVINNKGIEIKFNIHKGESILNGLQIKKIF